MSYVKTISLNGPGGSNHGIFAGLDDRPIFGAVGGKARGIFAGVGAVRSIAPPQAGGAKGIFAGLDGRKTRKGHAYHAVGGQSLVDSLLNAGSQILQDGTSTVTNDVENQGGDIATGLVNSSQFKVVLDKVQQRAEDGVKKVAGQNAIALTLIASGAGVVGATFLKGTVGMGLAAAIVAGGVYFIVKNSATSDQTTPKK